MDDTNQTNPQYSYSDASAQGSGGSSPTGGKPTGKYKSTAAFVTSIKIPVNDLSFDQNYFLQLIAGSIALRIDEKEKIVESIPKLSQKQVDELMKIFEEEKEEFDKLAEKYPEQIQQLREKAKTEWKVLEGKEDQKSETEENKSKVDNIKNMLQQKKETTNTDLDKAA